MQGIAISSMKSYSSAQNRYLGFCCMYHFPPLPLSEHCLCIFAVFLAQQDLKSQSISIYLSALRHLQVSASLPAPRLQYVLKGIQCSQPVSSRTRLPITAAIMTKLSTSCRSNFSNEIEARMCWAACCVGYYGSCVLVNL